MWLCLNLIFLFFASKYGLHIKCAAEVNFGGLFVPVFILLVNGHVQAACLIVFFFICLRFMPLYLQFIGEIKNILLLEVKLHY